MIGVALNELTFPKPEWDDLHGTNLDLWSRFLETCHLRWIQLVIE